MHNLYVGIFIQKNILLKFSSTRSLSSSSSEIINAVPYWALCLPWPYFMKSPRVWSPSQGESTWHGNTFHITGRFVRGIHQWLVDSHWGFHSQKVSNVVIWLLLLLLSKQSVEQTFEWLMIWDTMMLKQYHTNAGVQYDGLSPFP